MIALKLKSRTHGDKEVYYDNCDHDVVSKYHWHYYKASGLFYCATNIYLGKIDGKKKQKRVVMHRLLMNAKPGEIVDHRDGNGLNNTRLNLRLATSSQNAANIHTPIKSGTGYKGVYFCKVRKTYFTQIRKDQRLVSGGRFKTREEAAKRYNELAIQYFGEFATLNPV